MSDRKDPSGAARAVPGRTTPTPDYHYQQFSGKSGSVSSKPKAAPVQKIAALQNFTMTEGH